MTHSGRKIYCRPQIKSVSALVSRFDLALNINRLRDADTVLRMFWSQVKQVDLKSLFRSFKVSYSVYHFQFQEGRVPMNKLLVEMLEANSQWSDYLQKPPAYRAYHHLATTCWPFSDHLVISEAASGQLSLCQGDQLWSVQLESLANVLKGPRIFIFWLSMPACLSSSHLDHGWLYWLTSKYVHPSLL